MLEIKPSLRSITQITSLALRLHYYPVLHKMLALNKLQDKYDPALQFEKFASARGLLYSIASLKTKCRSSQRGCRRRRWS